MVSCYRFNELFVRIFSIIMIGLSVVILAMGAYLYAGLGDALSDVDLKSPTLATLVFGALLFVFSFCGLLGELWDNSYLMFVYVVGNLFITVGVLGAGIALLSYTDYLKNIEANDLQTGLEERILTYELAVFQNCCSQSNEAPQSCFDSDDEFPCYPDTELFNKFLSSIGDTTCGLLEKLEFNGHQLVSKVDTEACGGQDVKTFVNEISQFIQDNLTLLGGIDIGIGAFMFVLLFASCYLVWDTKDRKKNAPDYNDDYDAELM